MKNILMLLALALTCGGLASAQTVNSRTARVNFGTLTTATTSTSFNVSPLTPSQHTLQAVVTGSPTGCAIQLEGSLDGVTWSNLSGAQTCTSSVVFHVVQRPVDYVRANVTVLSGGSSPAVAIFYLGAQ